MGVVEHWDIMPVTVSKPRPVGEGGEEGDSATVPHRLCFPVLDLAVLSLRIQHLHEGNSQSLSGLFLGRGLRPPEGQPRAEPRDKGSA